MLQSSGLARVVNLSIDLDDGGNPDLQAIGSNLGTWGGGRSRVNKK